MSNTDPNTSNTSRKLEVEQACLAVCKQQNRGTVGVVVSDMDLCLMNLGLAQARGRVVEILRYGRRVQ